MGHSIDGDGRSYSLGSTFVEPAGHTWNLALRYMEINIVGDPDPAHSLSPTPKEIMDFQISHDRTTRFGRFYVGIGYSREDDEVSGLSISEVTGFLRWSTR
jgi:hypothetical protein